MDVSRGSYVQVVSTRKVYQSFDLQVKNHEYFMKLIT